MQSILLSCENLVLPGHAVEGIGGDNEYVLFIGWNTGTHVWYTLEDGLFLQRWKMPVTLATDWWKDTS